MQNPLPDPNEAPIAAILFDLDGTLLLTGDLHFEAMSQAFVQQGLQMPRGWYAGLTGLGRRDLFHRFASDFGAQVDVDRLVTDSIRFALDSSAKARPNPGVAAVAQAAAGRVPLAVVTNSEGVIARKLLDETGLRGLFDVVLCCEDAPRPKPAPDLYVTASRVLGIAAENCLVLEDSDQGLAAAAAAGMPSEDVRLSGWPTKSAASRLAAALLTPRAK